MASIPKNAYLRDSEVQKLHLVGGRRGIASIGGELPNNLIREIIMEADLLNHVPKLDKLRYMLDAEPPLGVDLHDLKVMIHGFGNHGMPLL